MKTENMILYAILAYAIYKMITTPPTGAEMAPLLGMPIRNCPQGYYGGTDFVGNPTCLPIGSVS